MQSSNQKLGRYELLEEVGCGGMATVFRALDTGLDRKVALKVMHPMLVHRKDGLKRFKREAKAVARLKHENIVEVYDYSDGNDTGGTPYLVCELIDGPNLGEFLEKNGPPLPEIAAVMGACLAKALEKAHQGGIIHRDIKPENILVDRTGRLVLTDFGIARLQGDETMTATGAIMGSPAFMSPEQARGGNLSPSSDVFSLGVVLYRTVTGRLPFSGTNALSTVSALLNGDFTPPLELRHDLGPDMDRIIKKCLSSRPEDRYNSMGSLAEDLRAMALMGGIDEPEDELKSYLQSPKEHLNRLENKIIINTLKRARQAKSPALALALCDRVLAADPNNPGAQALLKKLSASRIWKVAGLFLIGAILVGTTAFLAVSILLKPNSHKTSQKPSTKISFLSSNDAGVFFNDGNVSDLDGSSSQEAPTTEELTSINPETELSPQKKDISNKSRTNSTSSSLKTKDRDLRKTRETKRSRLEKGHSIQDGGIEKPGKKNKHKDASAPEPHPEKIKQGPTHGTLTLAITPWCNAKINGKPAGRSPDYSKKIKLKAGSYHVVCSQNDGGPAFSRTIVIEAGQNLTLRGSMPGKTVVSIRLSRGDKVSINDIKYSSGRKKITPGRHKVILFKDGVPIETSWVSFPPRTSCTLTDKPRLRCRQ